MAFFCGTTFFASMIFCYVYNKYLLCFETINEEATVGLYVKKNTVLNLINDASCKQACLVHEFSSWSHHGGERSSSGRLHAHPPIQISLVPVPGQPSPLQPRVDFQVMVRFLACLWQSPSLHSQFLCHCPDMVRLKSTAASDVSDSKVICLPCPFPSLPSGDLSWLQ